MPEKQRKERGKTDSESTGKRYGKETENLNILPAENRPLYSGGEAGFRKALQLYCCQQKELPPQQHRRRIIQIQSQPLCSHPPHPHPPPFPKLPPQQQRIRISQIRLHPFPPVLQPQLQSHPQFVAAKSLIIKASKTYLH